MYHKQPDEQDKTLAEWIAVQNKEKKRMEDYKHVDAESDSSRSNFSIADQVPELIHEEEQPQTPKRKRGRPRKNVSEKAVQEKASQIRSTKEKVENEVHKDAEIANTTKDKQIADLIAETRDYRDKLLKLDDLIIESNDLPKVQLSLRQVQRSELKGILEVLDLCLDEIEK